MYNNILFDLYGTLVDIRTDEEDIKVFEKLSLFYGYYGANYSPLELKKAYKEITKIENTYSHESFPELQIEYVFLELFEKKNIKAELSLAIHAGQFFRALTTEYIRLYDGVIELLEKLRKDGKKIYLLSNAQRIFTEYEMKYLKIHEYFDHIYISSDYKCKKPDLRFFNKPFKDFKLIKEETIMIGNDHICDIEGANNYGIDNLYIHSPLSPNIDPSIIDSNFKILDMNIEKIYEYVNIK